MFEVAVIASNRSAADRLQTSNFKLFTLPDVQAISETKPTNLKSVPHMRKICFFTLINFVFIFTIAAQDKFITLGSGGGFAGTTTVYKVTPKGKVFKGAGIGDVEFSMCGKIRKTKARQIVKRVADEVTESSFDHPGNLFYFISYTEDNNERTFKWGDANHPVQEDVKKLYDEVLASINGIRFKPIN